MVNYNGNIQENSNCTVESNRGFLYGDAVFETIKVLDNKVLFLEDHYFRLMASMRICRMEIPMNFTMEYFEEQLLSLTDKLLFASGSIEIDAKGKDALTELAKDLKSSFRLTVKNVNRIEEADMNQEFFDKIYGEGSVSTEEAFIEKMKEELELYI